MSEFDPTAYRLTISAKDVIYEACCHGGRLVSVDATLYGLAYRGALAAELLLQDHDGQPAYIALSRDTNQPLQLPDDTELCDRVFTTRPALVTLRMLDLYRAVGLDKQIALSRLIYIGQRAHVIIESESSRRILWMDRINVPSRINTAQPLDLIARDLLSS